MDGNSLMDLCYTDQRSAKSEHLFLYEHIYMNMNMNILADVTPLEGVIRLKCSNTKLPSCMHYI
jgi:hypothetical protein